MEFRFLVDVNLPKRFSFFNSEKFIHISDINPKMTDTEIWNYALKNNLVILTRDADFYNRYLLFVKSPKIVFFQLGNISLKDLHKYFNKNWDLIIKKLENGNLIIARINSIQILV